MAIKFLKKFFFPYWLALFFGKYSISHLLHFTFLADMLRPLVPPPLLGAISQDLMPLLAC